MRTTQPEAAEPMVEPSRPAEASVGSQSTTEPHQVEAATDILIAGRYTLLQKIGEGGMGEVWVAKQTEPVKRRVALKLIKPGMDSRAVLQRFEQERQALAMMDHPNIARVLDAGLTPNWPALLRDGAGQRPAPYQVLRRGEAHASRAARTVRADLPGGAACTPEGDRPS